MDLHEHAAVRTAANRAFLDTEAGRLSRLCHRMAERFSAGGRLLACGVRPADRSDARHVAVEFVHPVIVGKRALPALALGPEGGPLDAQVELLLEPDDVVMTFGAQAHAVLPAARSAGALTIAFDTGTGAEWELDPLVDDPLVRQELVETAYHVLWELVHVFFEHRGLLAGRAAAPVHDAGASSFLYPFLAEQETGLDAVLADVERSVRMKGAEVDALRERTLVDGAAALAGAAQELRSCFGSGGRVLALGNGGSATDAMDAVADLREPPAGRGWTPRPALDLTEDAAILTALANDVGAENVFARQVIAHGRPGDVVMAWTTSGGSANVVAALAEARRRGLRTVAFAGYDGGRIAAERLADHVVVTPSEHVPRIQEAQATAWHVLRALVEA